MSTRTILALAVLALAASAGTARATFPGRTGEIAFPMGAGSVNLYTANADGSALKQLTDAKGFNGCPNYSPDGATVAFCSNRTGKYEIWAIDAAGGNERQVTHLAYDALFPAFSRDGRRIYFDANDRGPAGEDIYVVSAAGGKVVRLTGAPGDDEYAAVSPDGKTIAFVSHRKGTTGQIWLMDANGKHQRQLTRDAPNKDEVPDWSPDEKQIAYQAGRDIWIMNADGTNAVNVTRGRGGFAFGPRWSPDGNLVAFVKRIGAVKQVMLVKPDGSSLHPLLHASAKQLIPAWRPLH
jgi:TolB protein